MLDSRTQAIDNKSSENGERGYVSAPPAVFLTKGGCESAGRKRKVFHEPSDIELGQVG